MRRRHFIQLIGSAAIFRPRASGAQPSTKPIVGMLIPSSQTATSAWVQAFQDGLQELGYVVHRDIEIAVRYSEGDNARLPRLAEELVHLEPKAIIAASVLSIRAVLHATALIPIVNPVLVEPALFGFAANDARPGGQITGILASLDSLPGKQLEIGLEAIPGVNKVGFLNDTSNPTLATNVIPHLEDAAASLKLKVVRADVYKADDLDGALQMLARQGVGLVFVPQDALFFTERQRIAALAIAAHLPTLYAFREHVEAGGLISYSINIRENYRRAATFIYKILRGATPGELPIELPTKLELVVNLKTAKALGIIIPPALTVRADEIIE
jgi:putative tryptophan/tyrosine transport system substrate-binding protein